MAAADPSAPSPLVEARVAELARRGVAAPGAAPADPRPAQPVWSALRELGTELWLDTGDLEEAERLWSAEFTALTTNNTLLAKEVGKGIYDELIRTAAQELGAAQGDLGEQALVREVGVLLNAHHGLRLVERFGCRVSVELHTDLAHDLEGSVRTARRLHAVCPSHFIVKVPLSPAGLLAARRLVREGIPINFTLGFSARQNYLVACVADPDFVNVFLGRLNSFVADHGLGDGRLVGEKATLASQRAVRECRARGGRSRQIAASMREAGQVEALAGVDVFTMPIAVAEGVPALGLPPDRLASQVESDPGVQLADGIDRGILAPLWDVPGALRASVAALVQEGLDDLSGDDLAGFLRRRGHRDLFPEWGPAELAAIAEDGKIPSYPRWRAALEGGEVGLDALFNAAGMASFAADQRALDDRIRSLL